MLIPGLLLGSDSSSRLFAIVVYERCQDFLDGHWEKLHGQIQYRKPPVLKALTPMNEEGRMWQMVERERQVGDVGKMAKVLQRSFDPPPPALRVGPLVEYNDLLPRPGEPTNRDDPHSKPRPPLPMEVRAAGTTTPLKALDVYRKAALPVLRASHSGCGACIWRSTTSWPRSLLALPIIVSRIYSPQRPETLWWPGWELSCISRASSPMSLGLGPLGSVNAICAPSQLHKCATSLEPF